MDDITKVSITRTRIEEYKVYAVGLDFLEFTSSYKSIRENYHYKGFECYSCGNQFENGEIISLMITDKGNKTVCRCCGLKIKHDLDKAREG